MIDGSTNSAREPLIWILIWVIYILRVSPSVALGQRRCCNNCFMAVPTARECVCGCVWGLQVQLKLQSQSQLPWPWPRLDYAIVWLSVSAVSLLSLCHCSRLDLSLSPSPSPCVGFQSRFWLLVADRYGGSGRSANCFRYSARRSVKPGGVSGHSTVNAGCGGDAHEEELNRRFVRWTLAGSRERGSRCHLWLSHLWQAFSW